MRIAKINFRNNPNIGLFSFSTDRFCLVNSFIDKNDLEIAQKVLKVKIIETQMLGTSLIGIFSAGNSKGIVVSKRLYKEEISKLKKHLDVLVLDTRYTALGNLILCNDRGCVISEKLKTKSKLIREFLDVETRVGSIAGLDLVGSLGVCNNNGCLVHKGIKPKEKKILERVLKVGVGLGTIKYGNPWVSSGLIINSRGFMAGDHTTGPEMGVISESLGFL